MMLGVVEVLVIAGVTLVMSFVGCLGAMVLLRHRDYLRKKKFVDVLIHNIEDQIETEMKFMDIARNFDAEGKDENDRGETK